MNDTQFINTQEVRAYEYQVRVVEVDHLLDHLYGKDLWQEVAEDVRDDRVDQWIKTNGADYYGAPKENYSIWEAIKMAEEDCLSMVVVEEYE